MSDLQQANDMERLMQLFLHDLRSPLGVAQGYMSLLAGQALSPEDRLRALRSVTDAIARITGLVDDVTTLMAEEKTESLQGSIAASLLCERVALEAGRRGMNVASRDACDIGKVRVGTSVDRLSEAITIMLSPTERQQRASPGPLNLAISNSGTELGFRIGEVGATHPRGPELGTFDPSAVGSVEHLKAYRHISLLGGQVWREVGETRACAVTMPLSAE
jgi:hypothetical protein